MFKDFMLLSTTETKVPQNCSIFSRKCDYSYYFHYY